MMNRGQLIQAAAARSRMTQWQIDEALTEVITVICTELAKGNSITIREFGRFDPYKRKFTGRDFATGAILPQKECMIVRFRPAEGIKKAMNKPKRARGKRRKI